MNQAYLLLGGNIGDRLANLRLAGKLIQDNIGNIHKYSHIYQTAAWGKTDEPSFLNQVILVETPLEANEVMANILLIESQMGRIRSYKNASRIIDIDILFFNNDIVQITGLTIPHPEISNRRFVLVPLSDIAPKLIHPNLKVTVEKLLYNCKDQLEVGLFNHTTDQKE